MARTISFSHADTPISGVTTNPVNVGLVNWAADWRVELDSSKEAVLTNIVAPIGLPHRVKIYVKFIPDIYKNSGIEPGYQLTDKRGLGIYLQMEDTGLVTSDTDLTLYAKVPVSSKLGVVVPYIPELTPTIAFDLWKRSLAMMVETGANTNSRIGNLLRGVLLPTDMR